MASRPVITLTTDFGTRDSYVGVMKGVILCICPDAQIIDITHEIAPQDIVAAALIVQSFGDYFPPGAIHVVVVDPGVGSARKALALATPQAQYVGPDNGIFWPVWQAAQTHESSADLRAVALTNVRYWLPNPSATFHGRDIFSPVAAHLARGVAIGDLGDDLGQITELALPDVHREGAAVIGEIVAIDHFGNCISAITAAHLETLGSRSDLRVIVGRHILPISRTYADVAPGTELALLGSGNRLEIAVRNGDAHRQLGITRGTSIRVEQITPDG